ncbi:glycosyltransferase-like 5 [Homarus americanus]|uniref:Glycosyltransferase-like 5 n=1 Tax=Homarus americanus TaxID=6706 RepID=A0A8J5MLY7_HOMAM|nr:glycosyltransferase-like 5 [Homarus americanus]
MNESRIKNKTQHHLASRKEHTEDREAGILSLNERNGYEIMAWKEGRRTQERNSIFRSHGRLFVGISEEKGFTEEEWKEEGRERVESGHGLRGGHRGAETTTNTTPGNGNTRLKERKAAVRGVEKRTGGRVKSSQAKILECQAWSAGSQALSGVLNYGMGQKHWYSTGTADERENKRLVMREQRIVKTNTSGSGGTREVMVMKNQVLDTPAGFWRYEGGDGNEEPGIGEKMKTKREADKPETRPGEERRWRRTGKGWQRSIVSLLDKTQGFFPPPKASNSRNLYISQIAPTAVRRPVQHIAAELARLFIVRKLKAHVELCKARNVLYSRETGRQTDRQTDRQTNRQTDRQIDRQTKRETKSERGSDIHFR